RGRFRGAAIDVPMREWGGVRPGSDLSRLEQDGETVRRIHAAETRAVRPQLAKERISRLLDAAPDHRDSEPSKRRPLRRKRRAKFVEIAGGREAESVHLAGGPEITRQLF